MSRPADLDARCFAVRRDGAWPASGLPGSAEGVPWDFEWPPR
jgi:hypothetical protein